MNLQETFDDLVNKMVLQGEQSLADDGTCAYGTWNGLHCPVGFLLDHSNKDLMEFQGDVEDLVDSFDRRVLPDIILDNEKLFKEIQRFHDIDNAKFRGSLKPIFMSYGLDVSNPNIDVWISMGQGGSKK